MKNQLRFLFWGLVMLSVTLFVRAAPLAGPTILVSRNGNIAANGASNSPDLSADGRYVVFAADASNLVSGDNNGRRDIFVVDTVLGSISRVSIRSNGAEANGDSFSPAISADGLIVVFYSLASNLGEDNSGVADVFAHDRQTGQTTLISKVFGGSADAGSYDPDVSGDGRYVVFWSSASNLVGGDDNFQDDVFRYDRVAQTMERVSVDSNEEEGNEHSHHPSISNDGQRVAFVSEASNLVSGDGNDFSDIFVRNISSGTTTRVNLSSSGSEANGDSWDNVAQLWTPQISGNGEYVVFVSFANNLVNGDNNNYPDVFAHNLNNNTTSRENLATNGTQANDWSEAPSISEDGRYISFQTLASSLVAGNISGSQDIFVRDRQTGTLVRASIDSNGLVADKSSELGVVAGDGRYVVFASKATNLVAGDTNGQRDIFLHDLQDPIPPPVLTVNYANGAPGSIFAFTGVHFAVNTSAALYVNGVYLGDVTPDGSGTINFQLISLIGDQEGWYAVRVVQGELQSTVAFELTSDEELRSGSGGGFNLPAGVALTNILYFPVIFQP